MVTRSEAFPSNYIAASDLQGHHVPVVMADVRQEEVGKDNELKYVLYFHGKEKGLILNVTNWNNIADVYGDDSDGWTGKQIVLFPATTDYQGRTVPCVRVKGPDKKSPAKHSAAAGKRAQQEPPPAQPGEGFAGHLDDEIPF